MDRTKRTSPGIYLYITRYTYKAGLHLCYIAQDTIGLRMTHRDLNKTLNLVSV